MKYCLEVTCVIMMIGTVFTSVSIPTNDFFMNLERKLENQGNSDEDREVVFGAEYLGKSPLNFAHNLESLRANLKKFSQHADDLIDADVMESAVNMYIANAERLHSLKNTHESNKNERRMNLVPVNLFNSDNSAIEPIAKPKTVRMERKLKQQRQVVEKSDEDGIERESDKLEDKYNMFELAKEGKLFDLDPHDMYEIGTGDMDRFMNEGMIGD